MAAVAAQIYGEALSGTQHGIWTLILPTGKTVKVQSVLSFLLEGDNLVCEKVYFDRGTILSQLGPVPSRQTQAKL